MSKFDPKHAEILDSKDRDAGDILRLLELGAEDIVLDLGTGTGFLTLPLSDIVSKVYAVDVQEEMLDRLREKCDTCENVDILLNEEGHIPVPSGAVDKAFLVNVLHEIDDRGTFDELYRVMKQEGEVCVVDWDKDAEGDGGPPDHERFTLDGAIEMMNEHGFTVFKTGKTKTHFHACFRKDTPV